MRRVIAAVIALALAGLGTFFLVCHLRDMEHAEVDGPGAALLGRSSIRDAL